MLVYVVVWVGGTRIGVEDCELCQCALGVGVGDMLRLAMVVCGDRLRAMVGYGEGCYIMVRYTGRAATFLMFNSVLLS